MSTRVPDPSTGKTFVPISLVVVVVVVVDSYPKRCLDVPDKDVRRSLMRRSMLRGAAAIIRAVLYVLLCSVSELNFTLGVLGLSRRPEILVYVWTHLALWS